jgi:O-antigen/teichoic acid export membrane protein
MHAQHITTSKRLIHNTFFNVVTQVVNAAIGFFLIRFFVGQLGEERYGVWVLIASIFLYRGMLSMGLNSAINRYIPVYLAKNNSEGVQRVISTSLFFFSALVVVFVVASLAIYYNISSWFVIKPDLVATAGILVLVVGFCFAVAMPLQLSSAVLSGLQRYDIVSLTALVPVVVRTVLLVVLLSRGYGLLTMGLAFGISEVVIRFLQFVFARKLLPEVSLSLKSIDFKLLRAMLAYGMNTFLYAMGAIIIYKASNVVIGIFLGTAEISQFAVAAAAVLLLSQFLQAFTQAIKPAVSDLDARDDRSRVREIALVTQKYSLLFIIPAGCFLILMGTEFLHIWVGEKFSDPSIVDHMGVLLTILTVGHCLRLAQHSNFLVLVGRGEHRIFGAFTALTALLCVSASVVSVKVFGWGLLGIAWSNCVPIILISGIFLPVYFCWKMRISIGESVRSVWWPALLGASPSVALIGVWKHLSPPTNWLSIALVVLSAGSLTVISSWLLSLSELERRRFLSVVLPRRSRKSELADRAIRD